MPASIGTLLDAVVSALRASGSFAHVSLGTAPAVATIPRAAVAVESLETFPADDVAGQRWQRARLTVDIHTRDTDAGDVTRRLHTLLDSAEAALLSDPSQSGICQSLPIGGATEVVSRNVTPGVRRPEAAATLTVRCHLVAQEGA